MRVLLVEDDERMAAAVRRGLEAEGIAVDHTPSGEDALWRAQTAGYAVIVLDVGLPGIDGIQTCQRLREAEVWAPVLMLTARDAVQDRVQGLNSGADDYLAKPFAFDELLIWRVACQPGVVVLAHSRSVAGRCGQLGGWRSGRLCATRGQTDIRGFGVPQDHGFVVGGRCLGSSVASPVGAGCS